MISSSSTSANRRWPPARSRRMLGLSNAWRHGRTRILIVSSIRNYRIVLDQLKQSALLTNIANVFSCSKTTEIIGQAPSRSYKHGRCWKGSTISANARLPVEVCRVDGFWCARDRCWQEQSSYMTDSLLFTIAISSDAQNGPQLGSRYGVRPYVVRLMCR